MRSPLLACSDLSAARAPTDTPTDRPLPLSVGFGSVALVLLLTALMIHFRFDDGSGRLYGSGVEGLFFVMAAQILCYGSGLIMYVGLGATDTNAHISAGLLGALVLVCPSITQAMAGSQEHSKANFRRGLWIAFLFSILWLSALLVLRYVCGVDTGLAVQAVSAYTIAFVLVMCLAIHCYITTTLIVFLIYLATAVAAIIFLYASYVPLAPVVTFCVLTLLGFGLPVALVLPLSRQRADKREGIQLDRFAHRLRSQEEEAAAARAAKPTGHRAKHLAKAKRLAAKAQHGALPRLLELSHNGVMERAGTVRWCHAASDGRPILPFMAQTVVARGSFLYLFSAEGELLPTTRATAAIPIYNARVSAVPEYVDERLPPLKFLLDIRLAIAWQRKGRLYMQLRTDAQMRAWAADLSHRARDDSSRSSFREALNQQAVQPDPSLAAGMLAVKKAMARAVDEKERRAVSKGISCFRGHEQGEASRSDDPRWAMAGQGGSGQGGSGHVTFAEAEQEAVVEERMPKPKLGEIARMGAKQHVHTRIGRAVRSKEEREREDGQELMATQLFSSVVVYTPRGISGSGNDLSLHYPVKKKRYPSLAASAREAKALNDEIDAYELKQYQDWLSGRGPRPSDAIVEKY